MRATCRRRILVLGAEQLEQRAVKLRREIDRRDRPLRRELVVGGDDAAPVAVDGGVEIEAARDQIRLPSSGAKPTTPTRPFEYGSARR